MFLNQIKNMHSPRKMVEVLGMSGWICLNGFVTLLLLMVLFVYLVFYLVIDFLARLGRFLSCFLNLLYAGIMLYLHSKKHAGHGTGAEMGLHASTFPILQALLSQISGTAQPIDLILDANLRKEVENNRQKIGTHC
jgi:hypothetical protein